MEDILDNHEFRRVVPGDGDFETPVNVTVFSVEPLLDTPGRLGIGLGCAGCSFLSLLKLRSLGDIGDVFSTVGIGGLWLREL